MYATYDPGDNKLRLYSSTRLDSETYTRVKAAGFKWAPKQELFVAPAWTPSREDLLLELCGEIDDEDTSLVERAEQRADRFEDYSDKRKDEAERAHNYVSSIANNIPLGQPILVGHHSERRARKDADRITNGMRKAISLWGTSTYWTDRAKGAIRAAKYKERPDVRARRIKGLEADKRKQERNKAEAEKFNKLWLNPEKELNFERARAIANHDYVSTCFTLDKYPREAPASQYEGSMSLWSALEGIITPEQARDLAVSCHNRTIRNCDRWIKHLENRIAYERAMLEEQGGLAAEKFDLQPGGQVLVRGEWLTIIRVNKSAGVPVSVTTNSRYVRVKNIEEIKGYKAPSAEVAEKVKAATKLAPLCNYAGEGFEHITQAQWNAKYKDNKGTKIIEATETIGRHRVRYMYGAGWKTIKVFITDAKVKPAPKAEAAAEPVVKVSDLPKQIDEATAQRDAERRMKALEESKAEDNNPFAAMKETLKAGVQVVSAPQLFPTSAEHADQMVDHADIREGQNILEPSAGSGNLIRAIARKVDLEKVNLHAIEINFELAKQLQIAFGTVATVHNFDFLEYLPEDFVPFDRIVMNPPFVNGADILHIKHALKMLAPGGLLVALCANGPRQREQLMPLASEWIDLPEGSFKEQGTNVNVALVIIYN